MVLVDGYIIIIIFSTFPLVASIKLMGDQLDYSSLLCAFCAYRALLGYSYIVFFDIIYPDIYIF